MLGVMEKSNSYKNIRKINQFEKMMYAERIKRNYSIQRIILVYD